jgi:ribonuclease E
MLDSERNTHETDSNGATGTNEATGHAAGTAPVPTAFDGPAQPAAPAVPAAVFQAPQVLFQPPSAGESDADADVGRPARRTRAARSQGGAADDDQPGTEAEAGTAARRTRATRSQGGAAGDDQPGTEAEAGTAARRTRGRTRSRVRAGVPDDDLFSTESAGAIAEADGADDEAATAGAPGTEDAEETPGTRRSSRRRRNTRTRSRGGADGDNFRASAGQGGAGQGAADDTAGDDLGADDDADAEGDEEAAGEPGTSRSRRRRKRRRGSADGAVLSPDDPPDTVVHVREAHNPADDVRAIKGSTRLEAKKQRRREGRESGRRRPPVITESEFLARRESVDRTMVVRQRGDRTQIAVLEDDVLVEHYVNRTTHASYVGNVYLGKVQNVLPSMEAAFVDIGKGRNAVLYAGEVNFDASGLEGQPKRIEAALKPGQSVIVQVTKDPVGHKGARLTSQVSLPGRYLVYVPGASMTGISRKLPDTERTRLKTILKKVTPENGGVIVRTAAEGAAEAELDRDITRLAAQWETIEKKAKTASAPALLYGEPDLTIRVVRDVFNEDFSKLIVSGQDGWEVIDEYVKYVAPHLADRLSRWDSDDDAQFANGAQADDVFAAYRIDEQLAKALDRKVWLPSGGSLVIDRTEAMTVVDVNTGKFTGQGGNLEETVTRNNLEAAEEIVRQLRLRDVGGIVVIDFIDMVLESNRELVLRRLLECLARDRTKHQVAEVTSLGLVQMTRKRVGAGLLEAFSQQCECCNGRGVIVTLDAPAEPAHRASAGTVHRPVPTPPGGGNGRAQGNSATGVRGGAGNANGRRGDRRGGYQDTAASVAAGPIAADTIAADAARADSALADEALTDEARAGTAPAAAGTAPAAAGTAPAGNGTAAEDSGAPRARRSTAAAGRAFATAVLVDDEPALVPVVPAAVPVAEPAVQASVSADAAATDAPPVRRTRAGSAVARVTVTTAPEPVVEPEPVAEPEPVTEPEAAAQAPVADATALATDEAPAADTTPATDAAPEAQAPEAEVAAAQPTDEAALPAAAPELPADEAPQFEPEAATEPEPEPAAAWFNEPVAVSPSVFDAPAFEGTAAETPGPEAPAAEPATSAESDAAEPAAPADDDVTPAAEPATEAEATPVGPETPADPETPAEA